MTTMYVFKDRQFFDYQQWKDYKSAYEARQAAFDSGLGRNLGTAAGRSAAAALFMQADPVERVEVAPRAGKFIDPSLTDRRVDARVNGELDGRVNKAGGVEFDVPTAVRNPDVDSTPGDLRMIRIDGYSGLPIKD